jgi:hypothetical protein
MLSEFLIKFLLVLIGIICIIIQNSDKNIQLRNEHMIKSRKC